MHRVLIVDDNEDIRDALRAILEAAGYDVAEAADGRDAFGIAGKYSDLRSVRSSGRVTPQ